MSPPLDVLHQANADIDEAVAWYEIKGQGIGRRFLAALDEVFERIAAHPLQFPEIDQDVRRGLLRRFPYGVYFLHEPPHSVVLAVLHLHRHPDAWRSRLPQ